MNEQIQTTPDVAALSERARGLLAQARQHAKRGERAQADRLYAEHAQLVSQLNAPYFAQLDAERK